MNVRLNNVILGLPMLTACAKAKAKAVAQAPRFAVATQRQDGSQALIYYDSEASL